PDQAPRPPLVLRGWVVFRSAQIARPRPCQPEEGWPLAAQAEGRAAWLGEIQGSGSFAAGSSPEPTQGTYDPRQGRLIPAALNPFASHGADRSCLPTRQFRLGHILRQQSSQAGVLCGLVADPKPHPQLTHFQLGDEAVWSKSNRFAQLLDRGLRVEIDAQGHSQKHSQFRNLRVLCHAFAKLRNQTGAFILLE